MTPSADTSRMWWFNWYHGRSWEFDGPRVFHLGFMGRKDLMRWSDDEGRLTPCVADFRVYYGRTAEARMEGRLDWFVRFSWRSEVGEIARRLAGGDE